MPQSSQSRASNAINLLADRNSWPLIADPDLRFVTPQLKTALDVWNAKRGMRTMPSRTDLSLRDLKTALPNLAFMDIVRDGARFRFKTRVVGTELDRFVGGPVTGHFIDEVVPPHFAEKWLALWQPAIDARVPTRTVGRVEFADQRYYISEALHAPLADDGETPDVLMLVAYFHFMNEHSTPSDGIAPQLIREIGKRAHYDAA